MARESGLFFCVEISLACVPFSKRGTPFPWREIPFPIEPSSVTIISSLTVHNGGGRPVASKGDKYIACFPIKQEWFAQSFPAATKSPQNYDDNMAVCMPPWIEQAKQNELCAYLSCRRFVDQDKPDQDFFKHKFLYLCSVSFAAGACARNTKERFAEAAQTSPKSQHQSQSGMFSSKHARPSLTNAIFQAASCVTCPPLTRRSTLCNGMEARTSRWFNSVVG